MSGRTKRRRKCELSCDEIKEMLRLVLTDGLQQREVADRFGVKPTLVYALVKNEKLHRNDIATIVRKTKAKKERRHKIVACVDGYVANDYHVWTTQQIRTALLESGGPLVGKHEVARVLKQDYGMSYRLMKKAAYQGNSQRCLVTRMLYAKKMLSLLEEGKRIINIDETWLPHLDFRNRKWRQRGQPNTMSTKSLTPKVNMIAALDTSGGLYLSLTQQNTDTDVMLMFMSRLANVLSQEDKDWRVDTYWLLDNASYHRSEAVRECLLGLGVKVILSGQYAYAAAPTELFFAYYKREDQNPQHDKTGKT